MHLKILLTGGGTGGHLYPGLAIVEEMKKRMNCEIGYVGTKRGVESRVIPEMEYQFYTIWMAGIHRGRFIVNLLFPIKMLVSLIQAMMIILIFRPDVVIGTGGYVSWPVMMAAWLLHTPRFIQEQNKQPGLVTCKLAPLMQGVFLSFQESRNYFKRKDHLHICGNPTRGDLEKTDRPKGYQKFQLNPQFTTLFIFGGSQGALGINQAMMERIEQLMKMDKLQILWATGPRWFENIDRNVRQYSNRIRPLPYITDMGAAYSIADLIVCRSGATTIAEITRLGKPALFIPFPGAAANHQEANAAVLAEANAAALVLESEIPSGQLDMILYDLLENTDKRERLAKEARKFGHPEASNMIVDQIMSEIQVSGDEKK
ncbi:undecaprenyldiphospho-muramoylpentapeptide beta-N-acetylglucosaminyltransferase [bacterium]